MAQTVYGYVHQTVILTHVDTRTDGAIPVLQVGWVIIVPQVILTLTIYYFTDSVFNVTSRKIRPQTNKKALACLILNKKSKVTHTLL